MKNHLILVCLISVVAAIFEPGDNSTVFKGEKCQVLTMRGGGTKGAYEIGVLNEMINLVDPKEMEYDVVEGISVGALNAAFLSTYEKGDEREAFKAIKQVWLENPIKTFWENWPIFGVVDSLWKPSLFDNSAMKHFVASTLNPRAIKRALVVKAVDLMTGDITVFDETIPQEEFGAAVTASASVPVFFSPTKVGNDLYIDGGAFSNLEIEEGIHKCREQGFEDKDIVVDIILCFDKIV